MGGIEYESDTFLLAQGFLLSCDPETDHLSDTDSYMLHVHLDDICANYRIHLFSCMDLVFVNLYFSRKKKTHEIAVNSI